MIHLLSLYDDGKKDVLSSSSIKSDNKSVNLFKENDYFDMHYFNIYEF